MSLETADSIAHEVEALTASIERDNRKRRTKTRDDVFLDDALQQWVDWLVAFVLPPKIRQRDAKGVTDVYDPGARTRRSNTEHSNPVLSALLAQEQQGHGWAVSVHLCILDMAATHRIALFGTAMEYSQTTIGQHIGLKQQRVGDCVAAARRLLLIDLRHRSHVLRSQQNARKRA